MREYIFSSGFEMGRWGSGIMQKELLEWVQKHGKVPKRLTKRDSETKGEEEERLAGNTLKLRNKTSRTTDTAKTCKACSRAQ